MQLSEDEIVDWPHPGPRAFREVCVSVAEAADTWAIYHDRWERSSGISGGHSLCHEHKTLCECFRLMQTTDQLLSLQQMSATSLQIRTI